MKFLATKQHLVAYQDSGEPYLPALFMAHPLGMSCNVWDVVCDQLHGHYRCIRWDLPGHGYSDKAAEGISIEVMAEDVLALADALEIECFSFIGTSIGGAIGQTLCQIASQRLEDVWLTNTGPIIGTKAGWSARADKVRRLGLDEIAPEIISRWFAPDFMTQHPDLVKGWQLQLARTDDESYAKLCEALSEVNNLNKLKHYDKRVLLIAGSEDVSTPPSSLETLKDEFVDARLIILQKVAHVPSVENPKALVEHIHHNPARERVGENGITYEQGLTQRKRILGDAHVEKSTKNATSLDSPFQKFITRTAWGELWGDNSLTFQQRSMITTAILASLGRDDELELHLRAAKRLGINESQLRQVLMHVAVYAGVPAANHAFGLAKKNGWGQPLSQ